MHVLMLSWEYPPRIVGGIARHLYDLANALADQGTKVTVVTAAFGDAPGYEEPRENLRIARTALGSVWPYDFESEIMHLNFALAAEAIRLAAGDPYDVVHAHDWLVAYAGNTVARALGVPLVSTIHQTEIGRNNGLHSLEQQYIHNVEWWLTYQSSRVIVCSGKVYYDLAAYRRENKIDDIAIVRLEQQYPFPHAAFKAEIAKYAKANEVVWCQEEPQNQGAWYRLRAYLRADSLDSQVVAFAGRPVSASPAVGYAAKHVAEQKQLIEDAFAEKLVAGEMIVAH